MTSIEDDAPPLSEQMAQEDAPENLLEQLAAKRRVLADTKEVNIPVTGYDREPPLLLIRYRLLEGPELSLIADKIQRESRSRWQRSISAAVDTFVKACVGFYVDLGDGLPQPLTLNGEHLTQFNRKLAVALKFDDELPDPETARAVVFGLFANNDSAIAQHNWLLNRWFSDTSINIGEEMLLAGNP